MEKRVRSFKDVAAQYWGAYVTRFQAGYTVPATPEYFQKNLAGEATSQLAWVEWKEDVQTIADIVFQTTLNYSIFYGQAVAAPLPSNPTDEFAAWYNSVHPFKGVVSNL